MSAGDISQFLHIFLQENSDRFEILNQELVALEENPYDEPRLYTILRHIHSLKGSAGMFGFETLKTVSHRLEDLMERIHKSPELVSREVMDTLFEGCDVLQSIFRRIVEGQNTDESSPRERTFLDRLTRVMTTLEGGLDITNIAADLLSGLDEIIASFGGIVDFSSVATDAGRLRKALADGSEQKLPAPGQTIFFAGTDVSAVMRDVLQLIEEAKAEHLPDSKIDQFFRQMSEFLTIVQKLEQPQAKELVKDAQESCAIFRDMELDFDQLQAEYFSQIISGLMPFVDQPAEAVGPTAAPDPAKESVAMLRKTVRIEETKIDKFLESVGEMIILGEVFNNLQKRLTSIAGRQHHDLLREFKGANIDFSKQVFQLQAALMDIRRVELRNVTAGLSRLVRDAANLLGKKLNLIVIGDTAVVDKSLLDDVNACLVHLVRNACDHGIETPQERIAAGKPPEGTIRVEAANEEGQLLLRVRDDGKGLNLEKIRRRAVELGIFTEKELAELSERETRDLIFHNGFSTAATVSEISGRGVGMSAVMENISKSGGSVEIKSAPGQGLEVALRIPLSIMLSVLDGLVVSSGGGGYIFPIRNVVETLALAGAEVVNYQNRGRCLQIRAGIIPLLSLAEGMGFTPSENKEGIGVVVRGSGGEEICLMVDDIVDHQQVVIKRIDGLEGVPGILGGALLGDGTIGLVLNPDYFVALCL